MASEDDLEEMKLLRVARQQQDLETEEEDPMESQKNMADVMGFSHFGGPKKAKDFDFMAMFEETRKTAVERSQHVLADRQDEEHKSKTKNVTSSSQGSSKVQGPKLKPAFKPAFKSAFGNAGDSDSGDEAAGSSQNRSGANRPQSSGSDSDDGNAIGPSLAAKPGKTEAGNQSGESDEDEMIGPPMPPGMQAEAEKDEEDEDDEEEDDNPVRKIPSSHEVLLDHGAKTVTALGLDPSGARLVSGGADYDVKLWDFAGMDANLRSFRTIRPCESHQIMSLEYSSTGDRILVVSANAQAKVVDRDGFEVMECIKGDQYLVDMAATKGHTAMLNAGCWNPKVKDEFMTCSNDGTVRLWNVDNGRHHKSIMKPKSQQGRKVTPTTCCYSRDGHYVATACQDGSIMLWDYRRPFVNVSLMKRGAHANGSDTSCLCFSYDNKVLASRGGDDTLKLWDIRQFKTSLCVANDLENIYPMTDCVFSPDDRMLVTGISVRKGEGSGKLVFLDRLNLQRMSELNVIEGESVVRCIWHPRLNQMVVGCGDGSVKVYYDPDKSHRGAKLCVVKTKRKAQHVEMMVGQNIITPYALPMYRQDKPTSTRKQEERDRKDPQKSHRPELPVSGPGSGGRLGAKGATLAQYVVQTLVKRKPDDRDKDPRGAILRHAKEAADNPFWISPAYASTQPEPVFQKPEDEHKEEEDVEPLWKKKRV